MMYTYESGKRDTSPDDRAHDHVAAVASRDSSTEDLTAALRVLDAMSDRAVLQPLYEKGTWDDLGNPIIDTPEQQLHWRTWSAASDLVDRVEHLRDALAHAMRPAGDAIDR